MENGSLVLSLDELHLLTFAAGVDLPAPFGDGERSNGLDQTATEVLERALVARGAADWNFDGEFEVVPPLAFVLRVASEPELVAAVRRRFGVDADSCTWLVTSVLSVSLEEMDHDLVRLTGGAPGEWLAQLLDFAVLVERAEVDAPGFELPVEHYRALVDAAPGADRARLAEAAGDDASRAAVGAFAKALDYQVAWTEVEIVHAESETVFAGGELAWLDAGEKGLWVVPTAEAVAPLTDGETEPVAPPVPEGITVEDLPVVSTDETFPVEVRPTTRDALVAELESYLPPEALEQVRETAS